jgi:hypoxanthine phosphoribosyltransferase
MREEAMPQSEPFRPLVSEAELQSAVNRVAAAISRDHGAGRPLVVVAVLKGALVFLADLIRCLPMPLEIELVKVRSYSGTRPRPEAQVLDSVAELDLKGKDVLLVDCVLDSGRTLSVLHEAIQRQHPASLKACVLLKKRRARELPVEPQYVGLEIPDTFVVGYGLDHANRWRHLPYVAELPAQGHGSPDGRAPCQD